ncbi:MAG: hypothetical protein ABEH83_03580 [Halobacterium sp.]
MVAYSPRALHVRQQALAAALLAYLASYVHGPTVEVAAVFGILAVLAFSAATIFDPDGRAAVAWTTPVLAAAIVLGSSTPVEQRLFSLGAAGVVVFGSMGYPLTATVSKLRDRTKKYR